MRAVVRSIALTAMAAGALALPATGAGAQQDPFAAFSTFQHTENMAPVGASLRPNPASGVYNSDLAFWGTKAYQGTYDGFRILDVSDPANPQQLIDYTACTGTSSSNQGDVIVWNNLLVRTWNSPSAAGRTCDGVPVPPQFEGLHVFDVSNPADPALVATVPLACGGSHTASGVPDPANNRLLVYNGSSSSTCSFFEIVEIPFNLPQLARIVGLAPTGRGCHDISIILGSANLVTCAGGNGFTTFSIGGSRGGSLTSPVELYRKSIDGVSIGHSSSFSWDGKVMIFGHEPGGGSSPRCQATSTALEKSLFFFDTATGNELGRWVLPRPQAVTENCTIHNFNVVPQSNRYIVVSGNYQSGISVVDFTDPANAVEIAYADPAPLSPQRLGGDWSSYWYNGHIYESDISRGLLIWRLDDDAVAGAQTLERLNPQTQETTIG